jgi:tRNA (mo5U34)-methyltransferase
MEWRFEPSFKIHDCGRGLNLEKAWTFDAPHALDFNKARQTFLAQFIPALRQQLELSSAIDVGCGVGYFSQFLADFGFHVLAVDGREENLIEARRRHPRIDFRAADVEEMTSAQTGTFDLVFCVGLLYHLENPFRALRNLFGITRKVLFLESSVVPGETPVLHLADESQTENQGLNHIAFYPTESCIVKLLFRAGFPFVYGFTALPAYHLFQDTPARQRERTLLVASRQPLSLPQLRLLREPTAFFDFWLPPDRRPWWSPGRAVSFLRWFVSSLRTPRRTA